jgi:indolepyruvate ferredoxin oxidoreductase alpha subunit
MKQVGLNVASDPVMCLAYIGVKGGMVIAVADDPGPISSQTEQDTRTFAKYANIPVLDPSSPEEAFEMTKYAFILSEEIGKPVILRPTTRACHATAAIDIPDFSREKKLGNYHFEKDPRFVIFPPLSFKRHNEFAEIYGNLSKRFDNSPFNRLAIGNKPVGIAAGGVTYAILSDVLDDLGVKNDVSLLKIGTPFPAPTGLYQRFIEVCEDILVLEELSAFIEEELIRECYSVDIKPQIIGKLSKDVDVAGELTYEKIRDYVIKLLGIEETFEITESSGSLTPMRAPVLCAGCPHRASFYAVKTAMKKENAVYCGDIGCYTLGNAKPLETTDTCLCMGADITIAQGIKRADSSAVVFAFIGDSTFFASGLTGVANAVYNQADINIIILDNGTTAMTGGQPHPGTAETMMKNLSKHIDIENVVRALGVDFVKKVNPLDLSAATDAVREAASVSGVSVVIFESPCINITKKTESYKIKNCIGCMKCIREIGCPAIIKSGKLAAIDESLCFGCGLCARLCERIVR